MTTLNQGLIDLHEVLADGNGRWTWRGIDVTYHPFRWRCQRGHGDYEQSITDSTYYSSEGLPICPECRDAEGYTMANGYCGITGCILSGHNQVEAVGIACACGCDGPSTTQVCCWHLDDVLAEGHRLISGSA